MRKVTFAMTETEMSLAVIDYRKEIKATLIHQNLTTTVILEIDDA